MAKTDWQMDDTVLPDDMNDIGEEINQLKTDLDTNFYNKSQFRFANIVKNSSGLLGLQHWSGTPGWASHDSPEYGNYIGISGPITSDAWEIIESDPIDVAIASHYTLSVDLNSSGSSGEGSVFVEVIPTDINNVIASIQADPGKQWHTKSTSLFTSSYNRIKIRLVVTYRVSNGQVGFARITLKESSNIQPYSLEGDIKSLFQAGNERKAEVVAALIAIGIPASTNETWAQLIPKIAAVIRATGNATAADVIAGKTFSNASANGLTGTIPDRGAGGIVTPGAADQTKAAGRYTSAITIKGVPVPADKVLTGTTIAGTAGTMPNRSAENNHMPGLESTVWAGDRFFIRPPQGYYNGESWITALVPWLVPENLRAGINANGVIGALQEGVRYASGNIGLIYPQSNQNVDCGFVPRVFIVSALTQGFDVRGATHIYQTADGLVRLADINTNFIYIPTRSMQQVMTIRANNSDRYLQNVIWEAWA